MHAELISGAQGQHFGLNLHLLPYFMYANCKGSDETARMRILVLILAARRCDKRQNLVHFFMLKNEKKNQIVSACLELLLNEFKLPFPT